MNGTACGFRVLDAVQAILSRESAGAVLVLVEAENGASVEIPSDRLMLIESWSEGA